MVMIRSTSWDKDKTTAAFGAEPLVSFLNSCLMTQGCQGTWWCQELGGLLSCSQLDSQLKVDRSSAETNWKENDANALSSKETAVILSPGMGSRRLFRGWNYSCFCLCPNIILEWSWPYLDCLSSHHGHGWKWYCPELCALNRWASQPGLWLPGQLPNKTGSFPLSALVQTSWQICANVCLSIWSYYSPGCVHAHLELRRHGGVLSSRLGWAMWWSFGSKDFIYKELLIY